MGSRSKIVELDVGNSRIKWRIRSIAERVSGNVLHEGVSATVADLSAQFDSIQILESAPEQVLVASVRGDDSLAQISEWSKRVWKIAPKIAIVSAEASGLRNSYSDVSRMGVDRWLAMLAAYQKTQAACLVVDSGTALTIDAITDEGQHLGGYILPGLGLGISAIESNTGIRLHQRDVDSANLGLGRNTESAVLNGVLAQAIALIEKVADQLETQGKQSTNRQDMSQVHVLLSGGDASTLQAALIDNSSLVLENCPSLVLDGLVLAHTEELG